MHYVYLLQSDDLARYVGSTSDLRRRLQEHNAGNVASTRGKHWRVVYYEAYVSKKDALRREAALKDGRARYHLFDRVAESLGSSA